MASERSANQTIPDALAATVASSHDEVVRFPIFPRSGATEGRERRVIRRALFAGICIWPAFSLVDVAMIFLLYPEVGIGWFLAYRCVGQAALAAGYLMARSPSVPLARLRTAQMLSFVTSGVLVAVMAVHLGGPRSAYMHGLSVVVLVYATLIPSNWRHATSSLAPIALSFPVVMAVAALLNPQYRAAWLSTEILLQAGSHYVFVLASTIIAVLSSHARWRADQQIFQARRLGEYRLKAPLGVGGMNEVWLAWDEKLRRNVALKLLRAGEGADAGAVRRFEREARAASDLRAPHTIRVFDYGASDDGIYYIAMEYLQGADLATLLKEHGPMPAARVVRLAVQACEALEEAHGAGVIHRDVKPANLYVTRAGGDDDFVKLLDFGIALIQRDDDATRTLPGIRGTPAFMAPELFLGHPASARSDLYALGATLYFMLTGTPPFTGADAVRMLSAHLQVRPDPPSLRLGRPVPAGLEAIVLRCLEKQPADRFESARALRSALIDCHDVGEWTEAEARRFWTVTRPLALAGSGAPTQP